MKKKNLGTNHTVCYCSRCQEYWCWDCDEVFTSDRAVVVRSARVKKIMHADGDCIPRHA